MNSIISYCPIDEGRRYLITDHCGRVYLLILERDKRNGSSSKLITDMKVFKQKSNFQIFKFHFLVGFPWSSIH
jgi:hypothetical protein